MPERELLEAQIRLSLQEAANRVNASEMFTTRVHDALLHKEAKENSMKKLFSVKKTVALIAVICCLGTATVFAAGKITSYISSSSSKASYTAIPTAARLIKDIGFAPKMTKTFSNGYSFQSATIANTAGKSDSGQTVASFKELNSVYRSAGGQQIILVANQAGGMDSDALAGQKAAYKGIELKYAKAAIKFVPVGYKPTQADEEARKNGSFSISYGSDKVETSHYQYATWKDGTVNYMLMAENSPISRDGLFGMAKELIDFK